MDRSQRGLEPEPPRQLPGDEALLRERPARATRELARGGKPHAAEPRPDRLLDPCGFLEFTPPRQPAGLPEPIAVARDRGLELIEAKILRGRDENHRRGKFGRTN